MEIFLTWLLFASIDLAAVLSPGPAFVFTISRALKYQRKTALLAAFGLGMGIMVQIILILAGLSVIISQSLFLSNFIKYAGAAYLVYIGIKSIKAPKRTLTDDIKAVSVDTKEPSVFGAIGQGFLANLLNPKAFVFLTAVFAQFIMPTTPIWVRVLYGATCVTFEILWFVTVVMFLTTPSIRRRFTAVMHWFERVCGGLLIGLGIKLALSK